MTTKLFTFGFSGDDTFRVFVLPVEGTDEQFADFDADLNATLTMGDGGVRAQQEKLEAQYGRHEIAYNDEFELLGFGSSEVAVEHQPELIAKWADVLRSFDFTVGEPSILTEDEYEAVEAAQRAKLEASA